MGTTRTATAQPTVPPTPTRPPTQTALPSGTRTHIVAKGETLSDIAKKYDTSVDALVRANALQNKDYVAFGQLLIVP